MMVRSWLSALVVVVVALPSAIQAGDTGASAGGGKVIVYSVVSSAESDEDYNPMDSLIASKQKAEIRNQISAAAAEYTSLLEAGGVKTPSPYTVTLEHQVYSKADQRAFLQANAGTCGNGLAQRFDEFHVMEQHHMAVEVFKYCALSVEYPPEKNVRGALFLDSASPLLLSSSSSLSSRRGLRDILSSRYGVAVLGDPTVFPGTIHGSFLYMLQSQREVAQKMLRLVVETPMDVLKVNPTLLPRTLYTFLQQHMEDPDSDLTPGMHGDLHSTWFLMETICRMEPLKRPERQETLTRTRTYKYTHQCPERNGYCCTVRIPHTAAVAEEHVDDHVMGPTLSGPVLMTKHPLMPYQRLPDLSIMPFNSETGHYNPDELPFIATIKEQVLSIAPADGSLDTQYRTAYEILLQDKGQDCLPTSHDCMHCLKDKMGANCTTCAAACPCYCEQLCSDTTTAAPSFPVRREWTVTPPLYHRDPNRLIPRIIHQTWYEPLTRERYPSMSRLVESFKRSGWEHKFYTDEAAASFISTHFPSQVRLAYDSLKPGAFKADLFRYCVLLIHGGLYADVDVHLESYLDIAIPSDVGFMVPVDEPGKPLHRQMCLWNGLIAAAPGHPVLAYTIQTIVNQVLNRYTSVDTDASLCPNPELSITHAYDTLFTAGPCMLGASLNRVLGRHGQTGFVPGELFPFTDEQKKATLEGTSFVFGTDENPTMRLPGRVIILRQNKWDMGAHRFTFEEINLVIAATDLPDSNDRDLLGDTEPVTAEHYSKAHAKTGVYGVENLYVDSKMHRAREEVRIYVDMTRQQQQHIQTTL